jgi:hypothetical protein
MPADPDPVNLPGGERLLALERQVRHSGTGLQVVDLLGCWHLALIWARGSRNPSSLSAALLRSLQARLTIAQVDGVLQLSNAVSIGPLALQFSGTGALLGRRPLLQFSFERLQLNLAGRVLLERPLPRPATGRWPFFALIARDPSGWLAARGRGGGLALWTLASRPA